MSQPVARVLEKAIDTCEQKWGSGFKIFFSPQGKRLDQSVLKNVASTLGVKKTSVSVSDDTKDSVQKNNNANSHVILVCPRYEGIDARLEEHYADLVLSIGDYVLMGGDLPAQVFLESFLRLIPKIVGKQDSVEQDSFSGPFLDYPSYGLPKVWKEKNVPEILLSGDHGKIDTWRKEQACKKTVLKRFDWFAQSKPDNDAIALAKKYIPAHYVVVMHSQIVIKGGRVGESSIGSVDIHDIARASATYGIKNYFIVSGLEDQHKILKTFLGFWHSEAGAKYNKSRYDAVALVRPKFSLQEVRDAIKAQENGQEPLIIATSAQQHGNAPVIDYSCQSQVWEKQRPVVFVFGTGQGLSDGVLDQSDFILTPVNGLTNYNHLSVRSAVSIILDRWLGLHPKGVGKNLEK